MLELLKQELKKDFRDDFGKKGVDLGMAKQQERDIRRFARVIEGLGVASLLLSLRDGSRLAHRSIRIASVLAFGIGAICDFGNTVALEVIDQLEVERGQARFHTPSKGWQKEKA